MWRLWIRIPSKAFMKQKKNLQTCIADYVLDKYDEKLYKKSKILIKIINGRNKMYRQKNKDNKKKTIEIARWMIFKKW